VQRKLFIYIYSAQREKKRLEALERRVSTAGTASKVKKWEKEETATKLKEGEAEDRKRLTYHCTRVTFHATNT
jgi:hypothetical protein